MAEETGETIASYINGLLLIQARTATDLLSSLVVEGVLRQDAAVRILRSIADVDTAEGADIVSPTILEVWRAAVNDAANAIEDPGTASEA
jgi:hypothetical protein